MSTEQLAKMRAGREAAAARRRLSHAETVAAYQDWLKAESAAWEAYFTTGAPGTRETWNAIKNAIPEIPKSAMYGTYYE